MNNNRKDKISKNKLKTKNRLRYPRISKNKTCKISVKKILKYYLKDKKVRNGKEYQW